MKDGVDIIEVVIGLMEWREARKEFFAAAKDEKGMVPRLIWDRLSNAEHALMDIANKTITL